ncbi:hypothetical protein [Pseudomonas sp. A014]|uniref:hypothetical protein n=1 Tax=Pseudomonas sp. A014 TaxID=3458058 RepID=UPI0040364FD7
MLTIMLPPQVPSQPLLLPSSSGPVSEGTPNVSSEEKPVVTEGVKVTLSGAGLQKASGSKNENSDIEDSGLPESIQQAIKMIREIKKQIAEKMAELQAIMGDNSLSPEDARIKVGNLQGQLSSLNGALSAANAALSEGMKNLKLGPDQSIVATTLAMS